MKSVSAIIPSYCGEKLLQKNLPAVLACLRTGDEIVIIDDASPKNSGLSWLDEEFRKEAKLKKINLKIIKNTSNLRYAASVNKAVENSKNELLFLLNNDVSPEPDCLRFLLDSFANEEVFAVACLEKDNSGQISGKNKLWFAKGLFVHSKADDFKSGPTAWATGGSMLCDKNKWQQLGGFDLHFYPAYWEDIDLSFRAKKRGWQVLFEEQAVVRHQHESSNQDAFGQKQITAMSWRNAQKFTLKNSNWWQRIAFFLWLPYWIFKRIRV